MSEFYPTPPTPEHRQQLKAMAEVMGEGNGSFKAMNERQEAAIEASQQAQALAEKANTPKVQALNDKAELEIYGSNGRTYTNPDTGDIIASPTKPLTGKLEEIRNNPRYGKTQAERERAANTYQKDLTELTSEGFELTQAKLIQDLREKDWDKRTQLATKFAIEGLSPEAAIEKAQTAYDRLDAARLKKIKENGIFSLEEYSAAHDKRQPQPTKPEPTPSSPAKPESAPKSKVHSRKWVVDPNKLKPHMKDNGAKEAKQEAGEVPEPAKPAAGEATVLPEDTPTPEAKAHGRFIFEEIGSRINPNGLQGDDDIDLISILVPDEEVAYFIDLDGRRIFKGKRRTTVADGNRITRGYDVEEFAILEDSKDFPEIIIGQPWQLDADHSTDEPIKKVIIDLKPEQSLEPAPAEGEDEEPAPKPGEDAPDDDGTKEEENQRRWLGRFIRHKQAEAEAADDDKTRPMPVANPGTSRNSKEGRTRRLRTRWAAGIALLAATGALAGVFAGGSHEDGDRAKPAETAPAKTETQPPASGEDKSKTTERPKVGSKKHQMKYGDGKASISLR